MTEAIGPLFAAGFQVITKGGYPILFLADANNAALQREGKAPVYHWLSNTVRLAQKDNGDYKFSFVHFVGRRNENTNIGVTGTEEVAGAMIGFSTTSSPPPAALQEACDELIARFRGSDDFYWGWRSPATPMFRPAPIVSNTMTITSLAPNADGSMPATATAPAGGGAPAPGGSGAPSAPGGNGAPPMGIRGRALANRAPALGLAQRPVFVASPRTVSLERGMRASNLDAWYCNLQGQGPGSITPFAENAFSGLVGSYPAAIVYASFHGGSSPITVWQLLQLKVWSPICEIRIHGDWSRVQDHLSAAAHGGGLFWSADLKAEYNAMRQNGTITTEILVDTTLPNAEKIQEAMEKRSDLVFQKFMDQAQKVIFDPAPYHEEAAQASGGFLGFGGGGALKLRRDRVDLTLDYQEKRQMAYLQASPISGQLDGLYDQIKSDPSAEKKYFQTIDMGDWERKVTRVFKPVCNWPDPSKKWVGQPVAFLSAQVGYPDAQGALQWDGHIFQATDRADETWQTGTAMKKKDDVTNPPAGWEPDRTFVKRQVHFGEPPNETENPFVRVSVERNVVDLDPGDIGAPLNDINLEVRVDNVGSLNLGPLFLNVDLESDKQIVEVTFQAQGKTLDGAERAPVKFSWKFSDQAEPRYWMVYTGDPEFLPKYKYQVRVLVKGSIFTKGLEWIGPWQEASGNGPLMVSVPTPEDEGVTKRDLLVPMTPSRLEPNAPTPQSGDVVGRPPVGAPNRPPASRGYPNQPPARTQLENSGWSLEPPVTGSGASRGVPANDKSGGAAPANDEGWAPLHTRVS